MSIVFTIAAKNYLAAVRVLMQSVAQHEPDCTRVLVLADRPDGRFVPEREDFQVITAEQLGLANFQRLAFKYTLLEFCTAIKAAAFRRLFGQTRAQRIIYLDPDIVLFRPLAEAWEDLEKSNLLLVPHLGPLTPQDGNTDMERRILPSGAYNLGFLGLRRTGETERFLNWWANCLAGACRADPDAGLFVDQRWMDLAAAYFEVAVLRHPGYDVAYWNLAQRQLERSPSGGYTAATAPLVFFHYSGYSPERPEQVCKYISGLQASRFGSCLQELLEDYRRRLSAAGHGTCNAWPYSYGFLSDGTPVKGRWREAVYHDAPSLRDLSDPFAAAPGVVRRFEQAYRDLPPQICGLWKHNYYRLAHSFPVRQMLWLRRRLLGIEDPAT